MEIPTEINGVPITTEPSSGMTSGTSLNETFDNFLTLLTTQLENQDPLSPMDTAQFTEQLVMFSSVEQALLTNEKLDDLIALQGGSQLNDAVNYIGKEVATDGELLALQSGLATIDYELGSSAETVQIDIMDASGQFVRRLSGPTDFGAHSVTWNGLDESGTQLPDGEYSLLVTASDSNGNPVAVTQGTTGMVTGVRLEGGEVVLSLGTIDVRLDEILSVRTPQPGVTGTAEAEPEEQTIDEPEILE